MILAKARPRRPVYLGIHRAADSREPAAYRISLAWLKGLPFHAGAFADALASGDTTAAIDHATDWEPQGIKATTALRPELLGAFQAGGLVTWKETRQTGPGLVFKDEFGKPKHGLSGRFDIINPRVELWASRNAAELVTRLEQSNKKALRELLTRAARDGIDLRRDPAAILDILDRSGGFGLDSVRLNAAYSYRRRLLERGFDDAYVRDRLKRLIDRYREARAHVIASHETMLAANTGQNEAWLQAYQDNLLAPNTTRQWLTAKTRVCPICKGFSGKQAPLGQQFVSDSGVVAPYPPSHVRCRCTTFLVEL